MVCVGGSSLRCTGAGAGVSYAHVAPCVLFHESPGMGKAKSASGAAPEAERVPCGESRAEPRAPRPGGRRSLSLVRSV